MLCIFGMDERSRYVCFQERYFYFRQKSDNFAPFVKLSCCPEFFVSCLRASDLQQLDFYFVPVLMKHALLK